MDMNDILQQAQMMQLELARAQEEIKEMKHTATSGGGMVKVTALGDGTIESILEVVQASFRRQLTQDQISLSMHDYARLEHNIVIRPIPLFIKNLAVAAVNGIMQKGITGTVSNVGKITIPEPYCSLIDRFSCFMAAPDVQISVCSFNGKMCFGVGSAFETNPVIMRFFRKMVALGVDVEIATNDSWE